MIACFAIGDFLKRRILTMTTWTGKVYSRNWFPTIDSCVAVVYRAHHQTTHEVTGNGSSLHFIVQYYRLTANIHDIFCAREKTVLYGSWHLQLLLWNDHTRRQCIHRQSSLFTLRTTIPPRQVHAESRMTQTRSRRSTGLRYWHTPRVSLALSRVGYATNDYRHITDHRDAVYSWIQNNRYNIIDSTSMQDPGNMKIIITGIFPTLFRERGRAMLLPTSLCF
jgi:hypothetical protein